MKQKRVCLNFDTPSRLCYLIILWDYFLEDLELFDFEELDFLESFEVEDFLLSFDFEDFLESVDFVAFLSFEAEVP